MAYNLGPVLPHVAAAANAVGPMFGITTAYGWRAADPFPDHPSGRAVDFMTSAGDALAQYFVAHAAEWSVDYIIWNRRSWNSVRKTWVPYTGSNPHIDHVHVTFFATPGTNGGLGGATPVGLPAGASPVSVYSETLEKLETLFVLLSDRGTWIRVGLFAGGSLLLAMGIFGATKVREQIEKAVGSG